ncbi:hypothetical protein [Haematobacter genomosp. 1]|nr:hypothetical protein [Haematobacter genomosp. 1]
MRLTFAVLALSALAACSSEGSYQEYMHMREGGAAGAAPASAIGGPSVSSSTLGAPAATYGDTAPAQERAAVFTGISDEQSFAAVRSRETIESDKARIEANARSYQQVAAVPLPQRTNTGPNIVAYALQTTNNVGEQRYSRVNPFRGNMNASACARYASPDLAQQAFLEAGGPENDRRSLDPDGDGFACDWDPTPFRNAMR